MKKELLLSLGLLAMIPAGLRAQVLVSEGFNAEQTKTATDVA